MFRCARALIALALAGSLMGCGHYSHSHRGTHVHSSGSGVAVGLGIVAGAAILAATREERREEPVVVYNTYYVNGPAPVVMPPTGPSPKDRVPANDDLPTFDPAAARTALNAVDVGSCRESGVPRGYGHAKVVWNPDGTISKVVVDEPAGLSPAAAKCVGDRLGTATVPAFRGSLVTVGTTWYVP